MLKKFGIKEANRIKLIANTLDQKKAILATLRLFGIPVTLKKEVAKLREKLKLKIGKRSKKIEKLDAKVSAEKTAQLNEMVKIDTLSSVNQKWNV